VRARWYLLGIALAAVGVAVWADTNLAVAIPAAGLALAVTGLLFVEAWVAVRPPAPSRAERPATPRDTFRATFRSGRLGRERLIGELDRLEREGPNPGLPVRDAAEVDRLVRLSPTDFREYLRRRLDALEANS
jgi:hypothetical protein